MYWLLAVPKYYLDKVKNLCFKGSLGRVNSWSILSSTKFDFGEVEEAIFKWSPGLLILYSDPGRTKKRLSCGRQSDVSRCQLDLRTHFVPSGLPKRRLERGLESDVSRVWLIMWTHFLPSGRPKMLFGQDRETDDSSGDWPYELIFCLLAVPKCDLCKDEKAMFQGVDWPYELFFFLLAGAYCDLGEVEKAMFQGSTGPRNKLSAFCRIKFRLGWVRESDVLKGRVALWTD
jgi:hypothetical protein